MSTGSSEEEILEALSKTYVFSGKKLKNSLDKYFLMMTKPHKDAVLAIVFGCEDKTERLIADQTRLLVNTMDKNNITADKFPRGYEISYENQRKFVACLKNPVAIKVFDDYLDRTIDDSKDLVYRFYNSSKNVASLANELSYSLKTAQSKIHSFNKGLDNLLLLKNNTATHLVFCIKQNITLKELFHYAGMLKREETRKNFYNYIECKSKPFGKQSSEDDPNQYHWSRVKKALVKVINEDLKTTPKTEIKPFTAQKPEKDL